jgi:hypothetical protein
VDCYTLIIHGVRVIVNGQAGAAEPAVIPHHGGLHEVAAIALVGIAAAIGVAVGRTAHGLVNGRRASHEAAAIGITAGMAPRRAAAAATGNTVTHCSQTLSGLLVSKARLPCAITVVTHIIHPVIDHADDIAAAVVIPAALMGSLTQLGRLTRRYRAGTWIWRWAGIWIIWPAFVRMPIATRGLWRWIFWALVDLAAATRRLMGSSAVG